MKSKPLLRTGSARVRPCQVVFWVSPRPEPCTLSLGKLSQCLTIITIKIFFLTLNWHCLYFNLCMVPLVLSLDTTEKRLALTSLLLSCKYLDPYKPFPSPSKPAQLSYYPTCFKPRGSILVLGYIAAYVSISCWGALCWTQHSRRVSPEFTREEVITSWAAGTSLPDTQPRRLSAFAARTNCWLTLTWSLLRAFFTKLLAIWPAPLSYSSSGAGLLTSLCWTSWGFCQTVSSAGNPLEYQPLLLNLYYLQNCRRYILSHHPNH